MKILHIINNLGPGGAEKLITDIVPLLNLEKNIETDILLLTNKENVYSHILKYSKVKVDIIKYNNMYDFRNAFEIAQYINKNEYDVVHSHLFPTQYWVAFSKKYIKNKKTKFVTTEHSTTNRRREYGFFRLIDKIVYSQYDTVISVGERTKLNLMKWINSKDKTKFISIDNGVDLSKIYSSEPYDRQNLKLDLRENDVLIGMVARFSIEKDQKTLIRAISLLPDNYHLVLVGIGELLEENKQLARKYEISQRVHFLGFRNDVYRILKTLDIIVLSSHLEGLSLSSLEGLAAGKPFVASKVPGLEELIKDCGILFEEENEEELAKILQNLTEDQELYQKISYLCYQKSKKYSIAKTVKKHLNIYNQ